MSDCRYWLGRRTGESVDLVDGCHSDPEGVVRAAKLHARIFDDRGPWVMVELHQVPDMEVSIDEAAVNICAELVRDRERAA